MKVQQPKEKFTSLKTLILQLQLSLELSQLQELLSAYSDFLLFFAEYSFLFETSPTETSLSQSTYTPSDTSFSTSDPARDGGNWWAYCGNNPLTFTDSSGLAYTYKVSENEYWFTADLTIFDKAFDDVMGFLPYSSMSRELSNATDRLNRIDDTLLGDAIKDGGKDYALDIASKSNSKLLSFIGKAVNYFDIGKTIEEVGHDFFDTQRVGKEQFIENTFFEVLKGTSRENVESLYKYAKENVDKLIESGDIQLEVNKKGELTNSIINNQKSIDNLYSELKNIQQEVNYGKEKN